MLRAGLAEWNARRGVAGAPRSGRPGRLGAPLLTARIRPHAPSAAPFGAVGTHLGSGFTREAAGGRSRLSLCPTLGSGFVRKIVSGCPFSAARCISLQMRGSTRQGNPHSALENVFGVEVRALSSRSKAASAFAVDELQIPKRSVEPVNEGKRFPSMPPWNTLGAVSAHVTKAACM